MSAEPDAWDDPIGAEIYADLAGGGWLYPALADALLSLVDPEDDERLLDLACGTGLIGERSRRSAAAGPLVLGVDAARSMLEVGRRRVPDPTAAFLLGDVGRLPLAGGSCDAAVCSAALWHFPGLRRTLAEVRRILRPVGRFAFNVPAAQLLGVEDLPPAPLQIALARAGERRFGHGPEPAGPSLVPGDLLSWSEQAGLETVCRRFRDYPVTQQELADLLAVPAFGGRGYPELDEREREAWIAEALSTVEPAQTVHVRFWEVLQRR